MGTDAIFTVGSSVPIGGVSQEVAYAKEVVADIIRDLASEPAEKFLEDSLIKESLLKAVKIDSEPKILSVHIIVDGLMGVSPLLPNSEERAVTFNPELQEKSVHVTSDTLRNYGQNG